jgi:PAS domain S-box-containing protein
MATKKDETKRKNKLVANKTRISAKKKQNKVAGINIDIQKQVKETLRLQAEIMNNMAEGVVLIRSRDAIIIYTNQRFEKMFEYGSGELIGKNIAIVNAPTDKSPEEVAGEILKSLKETGMWQGEVKNIKKDGTPFWCQANVSTYKQSEHGDVWIATHMDITRHKQAEEALHASETQYRRLFETARDGILIQDVAIGVVTDVNPFLIEMLGFPRDEFLGKAVWKLRCVKNSKIVKDLFRELQDKGYARYDDLLLETADGRRVDVEFIAYVYDVDNHRVIQCNIRDITERKLEEEALEASERNFRNSLDSSIIGISIGNHSDPYFYANQAFLNIYGYKDIDEVRRSPLQEHYTPESRNSFILRLEKIKRGESIPGEIEVDVIRKDGDTRHIRVFRKDILWFGKHTFQTIANDITERVQAEKALHQSEQNFRSSLDHSVLGIRIADDNGDIIYANKSLLDMFGYKNIEELRASPPQEHYTPESYAGFAQRHEKYLRGEPLPDHLEIDIIHKDGAVKHLRLSGQNVMWNGHWQRQVVYQDFTERIEAEKALKGSEEKYRLIVENSNDIIFTLNKKGEFIYISPSVKKVLGYGQNELVNVPFRSLVHPDDVHIIDEAERSHKQENYQFTKNEEYRFRDAKGMWRWLSSTGTPMTERQEKNFNFVGLARDITERKHAEKEKQELEDKAQVASRLAAVGEMAAGIAHEINNPLTGVIGFSQLLLEKQNVPEDIKDDIKIIADGSKRVADIVKRLLTFARQTKPIKISVNLNEVIDNTLKLRQYVLKTANINVVTNYDLELPWSVVDPGQMQEVFLNLIVNAEQAMKKAHGKGTLTITTEKTGNFIRVSFQDDGPGITRETMGHLFEPFFTTKDVGEGTGLGLSLSRSIVLEHGGKISVESKSGPGATFIVELPIVDSSSSEPENTSQMTKVQLSLEKSGRILVVDDEPGVRALLDKVLTQIGYTVDTITDAGIVMDKLVAGTRYDAILLDIRMPGMSGTELYAHIIQKLPVLKSKIIIVTGDVMGPDIKDFLTKNSLPYLVKPFDIKLLNENINKIIGSGQSTH